MRLSAFTPNGLFLLCWKQELHGCKQKEFHILKKQVKKRSWVAPYRQAGPCINVTDGEVMRAAAVMVITAGGRLERAASPCKAIVCILIDTAASVALRTVVVVITDSWGLYRRWRRGAGVGGVLAFLDRVRGLHCNTTFAGGSAIQIALHPDIPCLSPASTPWVPHNPVINTIFCAISNSSNSMVQCCPASSGEYTLKRDGGNQNIFNYIGSMPN